jgi:hypothetical protein
MRDPISHFPARALTQGENARFADWLSAAGDISLAYVSNRGTDDPAHYRRIVIVSKPGAGPSHLVHAPADRDIWVVFTLGRRTRIRRFPTLIKALNSVRPVLTNRNPADAAGEFKASMLPR